MEQNINDTIVFILSDVRIGGIATNVIKMMEGLHSLGKKIIWLHKSNFLFDRESISSFKKPYINEFVVEQYSLSEINGLLFDSKESVTVWTCSFSDFIFAEKIKRKSKRIKIDTILWIQHYKDFFEEAFSGIAKKVMYHLCRKAFIKMDENNCVFYISIPHKEGFENHYKYKVKDEYFKLSNSIESEECNYPFDEDDAKRRFELPYFNIVAIGRFDFPHKAFLIGLIRAYGELKSKHPQLRLTIIGEGAGRDQVLHEVKLLDVDAQKDLTLTGKVDYNQLPSYFADAKLNIGLAATVSDGAKCGVISLPVRHYSDSCETYGFLPESRNMTLSEEKGFDIRDYIEKVIRFDEETFVSYSRTSSQTYTKNNSRVLSSFRLHNLSNGCTIPTMLMIIYNAYKVLQNLKK